MLFMSLTDTMFQPPIFWLKPDAPRNAPAMVVTLAVFQPPMSALNVGLL